jgi:hypothetical protein
MINIEQAELFSLKGQTVVTPWDRLKKFIFNSYPVIKTPRKVSDVEQLTQLALEYQGVSDMVWVVVESTNASADFPWHYRPSDLGRLLIHEFPVTGKRTGRAMHWGDVKLVPTDGVVHGTVRNRIVSGYHDVDFDIVMISFHEAEADQNFAKLKQRFPEAMHVKNVEGIGYAHRQAAKMAKSEMVYIIDADAEVLDSFNFDYIPPMSKRKNTTYVWSARNPINGLEYGYGGIKLFPRVQLEALGHELPDFTTGAAFYQPVSDVSNVTAFNKDPYRTWRSAFRECVKLSSKVNPNQVDDETNQRLEAWCTVDNGGRFGRYCIKGALEGRAYGEANKDNIEALNKINDFEWLREQFVASMKKRITDD